MNLCDSIQARLAEEGVAIAQRDPDVRAHLDGCPRCTRVLADLRQLDIALGDLPEHDASDLLVTRTLDAVRRAGVPPAAPARPGRRRRMIAGSLAASVVLVASLGLTFSLFGPDPAQDPAALDIFSTYSGSETADPPLAVLRPKLEDQRVRAELDADANAAFPATESESQAGASQPFRTLESLQSIGSLGEVQKVQPPLARRQDGGLSSSTGGKERERFGQSRPAPRAPSADDAELRQQRLGNELEILARLGQERAAAIFEGSVSSGEAGSDEIAQAVAPLGSLQRNYQDRLRASTGSGDETSGSRSSRDRLAGRQGEDKKRPRRNVSVAGGAGDLDNAPAAQSGPERSRHGGFGDRTTLATVPDPRDRALRFLERYRSTVGVTFRDAHGYWSNTYIPGDPAMRHLQARLRDWKRTPLLADTRLEQTVRPLPQPFDAPRDAALALYVDADTPTITGPTRLRIQVGLKAAERQGGHRPAMNVGVVVDLRSAPTLEMATRIRALVLALARARQPEDRFSLIVAGGRSGLRVPPSRFRHGPLRLALDDMFNDRTASASPAPRLAQSLPQALARAREDVTRGHDASSVLGSSLLLLVTGSSMANELGTLKRMAHDSAVEGISLSVVSLGGRSDLQQVDRLVAAGQGNRRILATAADASTLIDRELHASSRAVARALRLRIRLAPGVRLIGVLGSSPLRTADVARTRQAEQAMDRHIARNLGIQADRGEDEEGMQIIIPSFYAGDSHVILLDVLAQRPGPLADVTVRYKDTLFLRNGVAQASLTVDDDPGASTPLQDSVLKNLVAFEFAGEMRAVGRELVQGQVRAAFIRLSALRDLLQGLRLEVAGWGNDPHLEQDVHLIETYLAVLNTPTGTDATQRLHIADSLRYAAFRKLQPVPERE